MRVLELPARDKAVLLWLAYYSGASWPTCWPSIGTLASDCGCSRRSVLDALRALERRGLIGERKRRKDSSNVYTLKLPLVGADSAPTVGADFAPTYVQESTLEPELFNDKEKSTEEEGIYPLDTYISLEREDE